MSCEKDGSHLSFCLVAYWHDPRWKGFVGASVKIWDMAGYLASMGNSVVAILPRCGIEKRHLPYKVIEIPVINLPGLRMVSYNLLLLFYLFFGKYKLRPDVIYQRRTTTIIPLLYARLLNALFFFEVNDDPYYYRLLNNKKDITGFLRNALSVWMDQRNIRAASRSFVISKAIIQKIKNKNPDISGNKFLLLPSGANVDIFKPIDRAAALKSIGHDASKLYIGFVGTLLAHQGVETLIESALSILQHQPDCMFFIVGEGPMKHAWEQKTKEKKLEKSILFLGQIPYEQMPVWINAMDVCVAPYSSSAGYRSPVKIFDYLACGRPVVASKIKGTTDIFVETDAVLFVEPESPAHLANAIIKLLDDPEARRLKGERGRQWVTANYSRKAMAEIVLDHAKELVKT